MEINRVKKSGILLLAIIAIICFAALIFPSGGYRAEAVADVYNNEVFRQKYKTL